MSWVGHDPAKPWDLSSSLSPSFHKITFGQATPTGKRIRGVW